MAGGYSNFDIVSHLGIRISDLSLVIGRANPPDLTKLESTFDVTVLYCSYSLTPVS